MNGFISPLLHEIFLSLNVELFSMRPTVGGNVYVAIHKRCVKYSSVWI